ncbi:MAG: TM0106 family RecB-like putative nuclease [Acidobacteria bacterium]|nr:TM0106 family RecB-like putative nuclease [Acidobacteriota bacterium]
MSGIRPLDGAEIARCPHRVALVRGGPQAMPERIADESSDRRRREVQKLVDQTLDDIATFFPEAVRPASVAETVAMVERGVEIILAPRLPDDEDGGRRAFVDVIVRTGRTESGYTYAPILIRNIVVGDSAATRRIRIGSSQQIRPSDAEWHDGVTHRRTPPVTRAGLALAHAYRVLEAHRWAASESVGGLFDRDGKLWWLDLGPDSATFSLEVYDAAFAERRAVLEQRELWENGGAPYPTTPFWHRECDYCPFSTSCRSILEESHDVSLVPWTKFSEQILLKEAGITTWDALAALDPQVATRAFQSVLSAAEPHSPSEYLGKQLQQLPDLIYKARARKFGGPLRKVPAADMSCPTADVEVDIDMESYSDQTYLWGAVVRCRGFDLSVRDGYHHFSYFTDVTAQDEGRIFREFWQWLSELRDKAHRQGATFRAYCFYQNAENSSMRAGIAADPANGHFTAPVEEFLASSEWVDLYEVSRTLLQTEGAMGLKNLAPVAGFHWRDDSPSGEASMAWFEHALREGEPWRTRILEYNEDDCRATQALRDWLNGAASTLIHRDDVS